MSKCQCGAAADSLQRHRLDCFEDTLMGIPVVLVDAVEEERCSQCGEVTKTIIPNQRGLIAAMAVTRVMDPLKLRGDEIRFLRKAMNSTARELAVRLEVSPEAISRWENCKDPISAPNEKILRLVVGGELCHDAPAIDFDPVALAGIRIQSVCLHDHINTMCFELIKFKREHQPKSNQWELLPQKAA